MAYINDTFLNCQAESPSIVIKRRMCPHWGVLMDLIQNTRGDSWVTGMLDIFGSGDGASDSKSKPFSPLHSVHYIT